MEHKPRLRPVLPGSTPTPTLIRNSSESNVYASITTVAIQNKNSNNDDNANDMAPPGNYSNNKKDSNNFNSVKSSQLKAIQKMVAKVLFTLYINLVIVNKITLCRSFLSKFARMFLP